MTTTSSARAKIALLFLLTLAAPPPASLGQGGQGGQGGTDREITDDMLKACPELEHAIGRKREQLLALYFDLALAKPEDEATRRTVRALFVLGKAQEDGDLVLAHMQKKGAYRCAAGVRVIVAALGTDGFLWALERFEKIPPEGRGRVLDALHSVRYREAWRFLEKCLDDRTAVPNWRAAQEAPPGYQDLRVCDHAFRLIGARLLRAEGVRMPQELKSGQISSTMKVEARDERISKLKRWIAEDKPYQDFRRAQPSAQDGLDEPGKERARLVFERLGIGG